MYRRHPLPRAWLITDERQGDRLWSALKTLPNEAGVIFRHYSLQAEARRAMFERVMAAGGGDRLYLLGGTPALARAWGAGGSYGGVTARKTSELIRAAAVHSRRELAAAERGGADLVFLSSLNPTRSHPGAPALGRLRFAVIARRARVPVIALGGIESSALYDWRRLNAYGWAGIDAWTAPGNELADKADQKRKAVPR